MSRSQSEVGARLGATAMAGMERWRDRLALVTGASGGIGAAVARALVQQGLKVVGCARTVGNIEELAAECKSAGYPGTLIPYRCDLSSEEDILSMFSAVRSQHSGVDICINNAGLARPDTLLSGSTSGWKDMFNVNVLGLSICAREAYQSMKERKVDDGHIININSATKYAVTALTEGLRQELREAQTHIRATCISPEVVETQFAFKLHDKDPEKAAATYERIKCLKPEDVAEAVLYVLSTPPHVQAPWPLFALFRLFLLIWGRDCGQKRGFPLKEVGREKPSPSMGVAIQSSRLPPLLALLPPSPPSLPPSQFSSPVLASWLPPG
ncbi:dehydrogenase/reductase SDR family member 11 isoform X2 [Neovison vison]|nr:dehydrogenase/reductase SDR family member 11 isoform X2 [Neogale vison]